MSRPEPGSRLSREETSWTLLRAAHAGSAAAREAIYQRYRQLIFRYLLAATRDVHTAEDLAQEFGLKLLRGDFRRAARERGRFRDYLRTVLIHLVASHRRRRRPGGDADQVPDRAHTAAEHPADLRRRQELLERTWAALRDRRPAAYTVLRLRADRPDASAAELADDLGRQRGRAVSADGLRQALHRARTAFVGLLLEEIAREVADRSPARLVEELQGLGLWDYCRPVLTGRLPPA
jgi:RNA polymerase sigma-70 factor (ECF subfamily)